MNTEYLKQWRDFIKSFKKNVLEHNSQNRLFDQLINKAEITRFYKNDLFVSIAQDLGLELSFKEYLRMDMILSKRGKTGNNLIPAIVVESENDPNGDLPNEINKLLSMNAPLKILITRFPSLEIELQNKFENHEDTHWYYPLKDFAEHKRLDCYFAVISLENYNIDKLQYAYACYDTNAVLIDSNCFQLD